MGNYREKSYGYINIEYNYKNKIITIKDDYNSFRCDISKNKLDNFISCIILLCDYSIIPEPQDNSEPSGYIFFGQNTRYVSNYSVKQVDFINGYREGGTINGNYFDKSQKDKLLHALSSFFRKKELVVKPPNDLDNTPMQLLLKMRNGKCLLSEWKN